MKSRRLLIAVFSLFLLNAIGFLAGTWRLIRFPFELDYGEGIILWQAARVFDLKEAYHPLGRYPYIVFHYPPLYHVLSRIVGMWTGDLLVGGRTVSWLAAISTAVVAGSLASTATRSRDSRRVAAIAATLFVLQLPALEWIPYMRVDITAVVLVLFGLAMFLRSDSRSLRLAAGAFFIVALFCKQTMVAAPAASVLTLVLSGCLREAALLSSIMFVPGLAVLGGITWYTHGEFVRHLFLYNLNPYSVTAFLEAFAANLNSIGIVSAVALGVGVTTGGLLLRSAKMVWKQDAAQRARICLTLYCLTAFVVSLSAGKAGAADNHFIEWNVACCILAAIAVSDLFSFRTDHTIGAASLIVLLTVGIFGVNQLPRTRRYVKVLMGRDWRWMSAQDTGRVFDEVKAVSGSVLSEDMVMLMNAGKEIPWEPAIMTQLAATRRFDETPAIERVRARAFSLIVVHNLNSTLFYSRRMRETILSNYEVKQVIGTYTIFTPVQ